MHLQIMDTKIHHFSLREAGLPQVTIQHAAQPQVQLAAQPHFNPVQVPLPDRFDFTSPDTWPAWVRRFDRFRVASGLCNRPANDQISTMVYAMGDQAEDILNTLHVPGDASYEELKQTLDAYFGVRRNLIIVRAKCDRRTQQPGESVDVFIKMYSDWPDIVTTVSSENSRSGIASSSG